MIIDKKLSKEVEHTSKEDHPNVHDDLDEMIHADHLHHHKTSDNRLFLAGMVMLLVIALHNFPEGMVIGAKVTLRGEKMYEFVDRFFNLALPRVRDFRGINPNAFDGRGNYAMGVKEQLIFPEIDYDKIDKVRGMDIIFVTTAKTDEEARELLTLMGAPFAR